MVVARWRVLPHLSAVLGEQHDVVDLDRFLAEYDALHGKG